MNGEVRGIVIRFGGKGYGFIRDMQGIEYFVHQKDIENSQRLFTDQEVVFVAENGTRGNIARDVRIVDGDGNHIPPEQPSSNNQNWREQRAPRHSNGHNNNFGAVPHRHCCGRRFIGTLFAVLFILQAITLYLILQK